LLWVQPTMLIPRLRARVLVVAPPWLPPGPRKKHGRFPVARAISRVVPSICAAWAARLILVKAIRGTEPATSCGWE
ncbi:MAG: hypothetical protein JWN54_879, partial [Mycobacterium sp.]|nr:hypothetical protein [Mycobacterium sp.]